MAEHSTHLRAVDSSEPVEESQSTIPGLTPPPRRGGTGRFLTDVLVERGYTDRENVERAIDKAREAGVTPERLLLDQHAISPEQLSLAIAERYGLDHIDLGSFNVDM